MNTQTSTYSHYRSQKPVAGKFTRLNGVSPHAVENRSFDRSARPRIRLPEVRFKVNSLGQYIPASVRDLETLSACGVSLSPHLAYEENGWGEVIGECRGHVWAVKPE